MIYTVAKSKERENRWVIAGHDPDSGYWAVLMEFGTEEQAYEALAGLVALNKAAEESKVAINTLSSKIFGGER